MLTSTRNPRVLAVASLSRRRERRARGVHLAEGVHAVRAALEAGLVEEVYATRDGARRLGPSPVPATLVDDHVLARMADAVTPQGVVAVVRTVTATISDVVGARVLLIVDRVADPGNLGTILRTAVAFGVRGVVLSTASADPFAPKTVRSTAGAVYGVPLVVEARLAEVIDACQAVNQRVAVLVPRGGADVATFAATGTGPAVALVLGSEAHGAGPEVLGRAESVSIAMPGDVESLNVAVATGIALHAVVAGNVDADDAPGGLGADER